MTDATLDDLRFPIGRFEAPEVVTPALRDGWIDDLAALPADLRRVVEPLDANWLDRPYRPAGWTVRQVVHHLADSHVNSLVRFKWALTEEHPTIKAYDEGAWARLPDAAAPVGPALDLLDALHARWVVLLRGLDEAQWARGFRHPESGDDVRLDVNAGIYAWHGRHHLAHVTALLAREGA